MFLITTNYQLIKFNAKGDSVAVFNNVKIWHPSLIDVSNPLRPLIYYKNFSTLLMLDRQLSLRNQINFRKGNIFSVSILAAAYDNNVWIFDEQDFKLKKLMPKVKCFLKQPIGECCLLNFQTRNG